MRVRITLENGEHLTGELYAVEVWHDYTDAAKRANVAEIEAIEIETQHVQVSTTVLYPNAS